MKNGKVTAVADVIYCKRMTEFVPPNPSSEKSAAGSGTHVFSSTRNRYSYRPAGRRMTLLHTPCSSGPSRMSLLAFQWLKSPTTATLLARGACSINFTPPSINEVCGRCRLHPIRRTERALDKNISAGLILHGRRNIFIIKHPRLVLAINIAAIVFLLWFGNISCGLPSGLQQS